METKVRLTAEVGARRYEEASRLAQAAGARALVLQELHEEAREAAESADIARVRRLGELRRVLDGAEVWVVEAGI